MFFLFDISSSLKVGTQYALDFLGAINLGNPFPSWREPKYHPVFIIFMFSLTGFSTMLLWGICFGKSWGEKNLTHYLCCRKSQKNKPHLTKSRNLFKEGSLARLLRHLVDICCYNWILPLIYSQWMGFLVSFNSPKLRICFFLTALLIYSSHKMQSNDLVYS